MSAPKFTPGPWVYRISESGAIAIFNAEGTWIATTLRKQWPKEDRANANLIAAASELYGEASRYLTILERAEADSELWARLTEGTGIATLNAYRAALAKAVTP